MTTFYKFPAPYRMMLRATRVRQTWVTMPFLQLQRLYNLGQVYLSMSSFIKWSNKNVSRDHRVMVN